MARQKCSFKWQDKSLRLNGKTKVYVKMARLNCTFKWQGKSEHFGEKAKSARLNGKTKVYD